MKMENRKKKSSILTVKANDGDIRKQQKKPEHTLAYINQVLIDLIPIIEKYGGNIDGRKDAGFTVYFEEDPEQAVRAAQAISKTGRFAYSSGISYGTVLWGCVGIGIHKSTISLSEDKKRSDLLQSYASRCGLSILLTAVYAEQITDFTRRFLHRWLGPISMAGAEEPEAVYELFEGEDEERIFLKQKTKMVFEEGIRLFQTGEPQRARKHFIEVLKIDRADQVAREYLKVCSRVGL